MPSSGSWSVSAGGDVFLSGGLDSSLISAVADTFMFTAQGPAIADVLGGIQGQPAVFPRHQVSARGRRALHPQDERLFGRAAPLGHTGHPRTGAGALRRGGGPRPARHGGRDSSLLLFCPPDPKLMPRWRFRASAPTKFLAVTHGTVTPPCGGKVRFPLGAVHGLPGGIYKGGRAGDIDPAAFVDARYQQTLAETSRCCRGGMRWRPGCARWSI